MKLHGNYTEATHRLASQGASGSQKCARSGCVPSRQLRVMDEALNLPLRPCHLVTSSASRKTLLKQQRRRAFNAQVPSLVKGKGHASLNKPILQLVNKPSLQKGKRESDMVKKINISKEPRTPDAETPRDVPAGVARPGVTVNSSDGGGQVRRGGRGA